MFLELPSKEDYPDYYVHIQHPIALDGIEARINGYRQPDDLRSDVRLMVDNAQSYNMKGSGVYKDAQTLWQVFERAYAKEFGPPPAGGESAAGGRKASLGGDKKASSASTKKSTAGPSPFLAIIEQLLQLRKGCVLPLFPFLLLHEHSHT